MNKTHHRIIYYSIESDTPTYNPYKWNAPLVIYTKE